MKGAVLCNGPSRVAYSPGGYDYVIGCNIPWTRVDATVVLDENVIKLWANNPDLITVPTYFSVKAWMYTDEIKKRDMFRPYLVKTITPKYPYHSSGHNAAEIAISKGCTTLDVYGCDSWFSKNGGGSYTRQHIKSGGIANGDMKAIEGWRKRWQEIIDENPEVSINFIKGDNEELYKSWI